MSNAKTGKTIICIEQKKKTVVASFDDGTSLKMGLDSFTDSPLYVGKTLSEKEFKNLAKLASSDEYFDYAVKICLANAKTVHEVYQKLESKGVEESSIKTILSRLRQAGLLDDEAYAKSFLEDVAELRLYGRDRVLLELKKRGISESILSSLSFDEEKERRRAYAYAEMLNKRYGSIPNAKKKQKMYLGLLERGYQESIAYEAIASCLTPNDRDKENASLLKEYQLSKIKYEKKYSGYELQQHIFARLLRKGYSYEDMRDIAEEDITND